MIVSSITLILLVKHPFLVMWAVLIGNMVAIISIVVTCFYRARLAFQVQDIFNDPSQETLTEAEARRLTSIIGENAPLLIILGIIGFAIFIGLATLLRIYHHKVHHITLLLHVATDFLAWNPYLIVLAGILSVLSLINFLAWEFIVM